MYETHMRGVLKVLPIRAKLRDTHAIYDANTQILVQLCYLKKSRPTHFNTRSLKPVLRVSSFFLQRLNQILKKYH